MSSNVPAGIPFPRAGSPNLLIRIVWFLVVGWWLGGVLSATAWFLNATIIGLPFGLWIINRLPTFMTLKSQDQIWHVEGEGIVRVKQLPFLIRAVYFVLIGWWFSSIWMAVAYALMLTIIGVPFAFWMYNRVGAITTLFRS